MRRMTLVLAAALLLGAPVRAQTLPTNGPRAAMTAMLAYLASEKPEQLSRVRRAMPPGRDGQPMQWPSCVPAARSVSQSTR
jgi:hypothetical protein